MLTALACLSALVFGAIVLTSLYFSRESATVDRLCLAIALDLLAAATLLFAFLVAVFAEAFSWISVLISGVGAAYCLVMAWHSARRVTQMEAGR